MKPTPEQLARINQLAKSPLTDDQVYVFNAKLIGDKEIPNRFEQVSPNFLRKMAQQAQEGVALLIDHPWASGGFFGGSRIAIPYGRTFDASIQQEQDGELALYADHYIVRGQTFHGLNTDDIISAIDAGTMFDTSVGYGVTKATCSIDGLDYYGGQCPHFKGQNYDGQVCKVTDEDGYLMENSLVFDGAYPGAGIVAASVTGANEHVEKTTNVVLTEDAAVLKNAERVLCSFSSKRGLNTYAQFGNRATSTTEVPLANSQPERNDSVNELEQARQQLSVATGYLASVRTALGVSTDAEITAALTKLSTKAQIGEQYATRVVDEACGAGVRALGEAFNVDSMKAAFSALSVSEVEKIRDTYNAQAQVALGGGGRHTQGNDPELPGNPLKNGGAGDQTDEEKLAKAREEARASLAKIAPNQLKDGE